MSSTPYMKETDSSGKTNYRPWSVVVAPDYELHRDPLANGPGASLQISLDTFPLADTSLTVAERLNTCFAPRWQFHGDHPHSNDDVCQVCKLTDEPPVKAGGLLYMCGAPHNGA